MTLDSLKVATILCPTDFSVFSSRAFRHALAFAHLFKARVKVVHVLPLLPTVAGSPYFPTPIFASPEQAKAAKEEMQRFVEAAAGSGIDVATEIRDGEPWREILAAARELPADLVTLGTHGRSGFERFALGSVTEKLLGHLPCPALTVCHEEGQTWEAPGLLKRIVCATDFSGPAMEAVAGALALANRCRSELTVVHVIDALPDADEPAYYSAPELASLRQALEEEARPRLQAAAPEVTASGIKVGKRLAVGRAHEKILQIAAAERADLIVLGTRGHGPLGRMLFGSTSERVVRQATCPVVSVPPAGGDRIPSRDVSSSSVETQLTR